MDEKEPQQQEDETVVLILGGDAAGLVILGGGVVIHAADTASGIALWNACTTSVIVFSSLYAGKITAMVLKLQSS